MLANDSDPDGDSLAVADAGVTILAEGTLTIDADGDYSYRSDGSRCGASDTFTYTVSDGKGGEATAKLTLQVLCVNHPPVATADAYATSEDTAIVVSTADGVLANDSDPDGDPPRPSSSRALHMPPPSAWTATVASATRRPRIQR